VILNESELRAWGESIGACAKLPLFIALRGTLGAGKSVLARAIARGAGVAGPMPSPTFNLLYRYDGADGVEVNHLDLYRLEDPEEVWELGWSELGVGRQIVLVEWPERAEALLPEPRWEITLTETDDPLLRRVEYQAVGELAPIPEPAKLHD